jgi:hypothetical protein
VPRDPPASARIKIFLEAASFIGRQRIQNFESDFGPFPVPG